MLINFVSNSQIKSSKVHFSKVKMSIRSQKRRAGISFEENEEDQSENLLRVSSIIIGEEMDPEPSSSESRTLPQVDQSFENLKASLRKEITEEVKTLREPSQKELIMTTRSSNLENRPSNNDEVLKTPISASLTPTKTVRFENANTSVNVRNRG